MDQIDVILVTFNDATCVGKCLDSLKEASSRYRFNVTVADNHSEDDSISVVQSHWPEAKVIQAKANLGWAGGSNLALRTVQESGSKAAAILMLNPDVVLPQGAIDQLAEILFRYEDVGAVCPRSIEAGEFDSPFVMRSLWGRLLKRGFRGQTGAVETDRLIGCVMLFRPRVIEDVGLLDEEYFLYWEELDYCQRCLKKQWKLLIVPDVKVPHRLNAAERTRTVFYSYRNQFLFVSKHFGVMAGFLFLVKRMAWTTPRQLAAFWRSGRYDLLKAAFHGLSEGFMGRKGRCPAYN
jgi:N-acetylglucosaminyl-diphospho-decaprenol L-rhamnosyltransferase